MLHVKTKTQNNQDTLQGLPLSTYPLLLQLSSLLNKKAILLFYTFIKSLRGIKYSSAHSLPSHTISEATRMSIYDRAVVSSITSLLAPHFLRKPRTSLKIERSALFCLNRLLYNRFVIEYTISGSFYFKTQERYLV